MKKLLLLLLISLLLLTLLCACVGGNNNETSVVLSSSAASSVQSQSSSTVTSTEQSFETSAVSDTSSVLSESSSEPVSSQTESEDVSLVQSQAQSQTSSVFDETSESSSESSESSQEAIDKVFVSNGIIIAGTRAMEPFGGSASSGALTAEKMNTFKNAVGDVNVWAMPIPLACAFYAPEKYQKSMTRHYDCFYGLRDALVNVGFVDTLAAIEPHKNEDIYARTDHHWFALGAYYAAQELVKTASLPFTQLSGFETKSFDGFVGSMYGYSKSSVIKNNPETFTWYEPQQAYTAEFYTVSYCKNPFEHSLFFSSNSYSKFIGGDSYTTHIQTGVQNGRKLMIFKDSYGNALAPFVISSFEEVWIADIREFALSAPDFIEEHGITDVCFALSAFSVAGTKRNYITGLLN